MEIQKTQSTTLKKTNTHTHRKNIMINKLKKQTINNNKTKQIQKQHTTT